MNRWGTMVIAAALPFLFGSTIIQTHICDLPATPILSISSSAVTTTASSFMVAGVTTPLSTVTILADGQQAATATSDSDGAFRMQLTLATGSHNGIVRASNSCGTSDATPFAVTVTAASPAPVSSPTEPAASSASGISTTTTAAPQAPLTVIITQPATNEEVSEATSIALVGTTNDPATETVTNNGSPVATIDTLGTSFRLSVPLKIGKNSITVEAASDASTARASVTVTRAPLMQATAQPLHKTVKAPVVAIGCLLAGGICIMLLGIFIQRKRRRHGGLST